MNSEGSDRARHGWQDRTSPRGRHRVRPADGEARVEPTGPSLVAAKLYASLALAEQHVADGDKRLVRQQEIVDRLRRNGHDLELALRMLRRLEEAQRSHLADRASLLAELYRD